MYLVNFLAPTGGSSSEALDLLLEVDPPLPSNNYSNLFTGNKLTNETWKRASNSSNLKTIDYTFTGNKLTTELRKVYAANGTSVVGQLTISYTYSGSRLTAETVVRDL